MKKLAKQLIRLGEERPELRDHIRPVLDGLGASNHSRGCKPCQKRKRSSRGPFMFEPQERDKASGFVVFYDRKTDQYCVAGSASDYAYECGEEREMESLADELNRYYS